MVLSVQRLQTLHEMEKYLGVSFTNIELLNNALTHRSFARENKNNTLPDNERLEFLGDAILKLIVSEYLFKTYPQQNEGYLTKLRSLIVSDTMLAEISKIHKLGNFLQMSKNEFTNGGAMRKSNIANLLEALFGAVFLDQGLDKARELVLKLLQPLFAQAEAMIKVTDYKSLLQEQVQALGWKLPEYRVIQELGPEHDKTFMVQVRVGKGLKKYKEEGSGRTKKEAEQMAAEKLLKEIDLTREK